MELVVWYGNLVLMLVAVLTVAPAHREIVVPKMPCAARASTPVRIRSRPFAAHRAARCSFGRNPT